MNDNKKIKIDLLDELIGKIVNREVVHLYNDSKYLTGYALCQHDIIDEILSLRCQIDDILVQDADEAYLIIIKSLKNDNKRYKEFTKEIVDICLHSSDEKYVVEKLRNAIAEHGISTHDGSLLYKSLEEDEVEENEIHN